jgi:TolB-like protein
MDDAPLSAGPFTLFPGRELRRDGRILAVGQRGLMVLEPMLRADGAVVTKSDLMDQAWQGLVVEEGNLTVQIAALRKELGARPDGGDWIVTVPRVGYRFAAEPAPSEAAASVEAGRPTLAVLPFVNFSEADQNDYFADGLVADLITALSRFRSFAVVSRTSSFAYKGRAIDAREVARQLGVRYLLEGSVRRAGQRVRVTVQLIDATSGVHIWATSFDGEFDQIFDFQDRVTESVVGLVEPQIRRAEIERLRRSWPASPQAYDHFLRALPHFYSRDPNGYLEALRHLDQAIALQPDYAVALAYASWAYARRGVVALEFLSPADAERCIALARQALLYGGDDPVVMAIAAHSLLVIGHMKQEGLATASRAMEANPNNVVVLVLVGICNMVMGDLELAETAYKRAYTLSPGGLEAYESLAGVGFTYYLRGSYETAIEWLERSRATLVDWPPTYWMLGAALAHLGRMDEARETVRRLKTIAPHTTLERMAVLRDRMDERYDSIPVGLAAAGLE